MSWMDQWYKSLADHNQGKCVPADCRHCKREADERQRNASAIAASKILFNDIKDTIIAHVKADYNGGYDEGFVDYVSYYDKFGQLIRQDDTYKTDELSHPWQKWTKQMTEIAWSILGYGFGTGEYSCAGTIELDIVEGKLLHNKAEIANLREAA
jgi:hypothetical protein